MFMLKRTHERVLNEREEFYQKQLLEKQEKINELIVKNTEDVRTARENLKRIENNYQKLLEEEKKILKKKIKEKNDELIKIEEKVRSLHARIGGLTKQANKANELKKELEEKDKELKKAKELIKEFSKPTKQQAIYENPKYNKTDKSKLVDSDLKAKREKAKKYIEREEVK